MSDAPSIDWMDSHPHGSTYVPERDKARLNAQCQRVHDQLVNGQWWTLRTLSLATGDPEASVSARIRDLRKHGYKVDREYVERGLHRYRMVRG